MLHKILAALLIGLFAYEFLKPESNEFTTEVVYPTDFIECVVYKQNGTTALSCYRVPEAPQP